ncbi:DoxX family membrane protein [Stappia sp. GBMRC 2046]|uniref:DoxX family membrane protein n=1 Tax=Stappia sediminis TaxID=2692190 RepID=A0A7X3LUI0_9HYPH|nr:DoxX family membrane protein [Stappia sediminis]MXN65361.1 DoxX family membrane protein [Stappia sediminis]
MTIDERITSLWARRIALLLLRVTTGFLLVWFGLNKVVSGSAPLAVRRSFEIDGALQTAVGLAAGVGEVLVGALCVLGLWRRLVLPVQAVINGSTAVMVWWAILDPFRWYITGVDRIVFNSHVFYPTSITFAACLLLIAFREQDTLALDTLRAKRRLEAA